MCIEVASLPREFYNFKITNGQITSDWLKLQKSLESCIIQDFKNAHDFSVGQINQKFLASKSIHNYVHKFIGIKWPKTRGQKWLK